MLEVHLLESEHLATDRAGELGAIIRVDFHVTVQVVFPHKAFVADGALVFLVAQVYQHVFLQVVPYCESLGALGARKHLGVLVSVRVVATQLL